MQMPVWQDDVHSEQHVQHEAPLLQESEKRQISSSPAVVSSSSVADEEAAMRKIFTGSHLAAHLAELTRNGQLPTKHCSNEIKTSKYSIIPLSPNFFLYKNLFEQFQRAANVYFLFIAILQLIPGVSPTGRFTTISPLSFVMFVSLLKDVWEDYKRHMLDGALNNSDACAFRRGEWTTIAWKEVEVGDLLMIEKSLPFPADMVMLSSTEPDGLCYIETSSLDGETDAADDRVHPSPWSRPTQHEGCIRNRDLHRARNQTDEELVGKTAQDVEHGSHHEQAGAVHLRIPSVPLLYVLPGPWVLHSFTSHPLVS